MDTDKIKIFGAKVKVDGTGKLAELERAEKVSERTSPRADSEEVGLSRVQTLTTFLPHLRTK